MKNEAAVWAAFRSHLPSSIMRRRIEDASGNLGTWDLFLAAGGRANWLELKCDGPNAKPKLRPGQASFGRNLFDAGLTSGYLVGSPNGTVRLIGQLTVGEDWRDHLIWTRTAMDRETVLMTLSYLELSGT
jgi:hypothetical protein